MNRTVKLKGHSKPIILVRDVPRLRANSMRKGGYDDGHTRHCLMGWRNTLVNGNSHKDVEYDTFDNSPRSCPIAKELAKTIRLRLKGKRPAKGGDNMAVIVCFNDHKDTTRAEAAAVWNETMERIGLLTPAA